VKEVKISQAQDGLESLGGLVTPDEFMKDQKKVILTFNEGNKEVFKIEDEVEL
jgi:hypothetical protein